MLCHEIIVSLNKTNLFPLDFKSIYFNKLKSIEPYKPFGNFHVSLIEQSNISLQFYCKKKETNYKLPITGDYSLVNHKKNVPEIKAYVSNLVEKVKSKIIYKFLEGVIEIGEKEFNVNEFVKIKPETFATVHNPTKKFQEADSIFLKFDFKVNIEERN